MNLAKPRYACNVSAVTMSKTAWIVAAAVVATASAVVEDSRLEQGRLQYELAKSDSRLPRYGDCWKSAVRDLEEGCKRLTDDEQGGNSTMRSILVTTTSNPVTWCWWFMYWDFQKSSGKG